MSPGDDPAHPPRDLAQARRAFPYVSSRRLLCSSTGCPARFSRSLSKLVEQHRALLSAQLVQSRIGPGSTLGTCRSGNSTEPGAESPRLIPDRSRSDWLVSRQISKPPPRPVSPPIPSQMAGGLYPACVQQLGRKPGGAEPVHSVEISQPKTVRAKRYSPVLTVVIALTPT